MIEQKNSYKHEELLECAKGNMFGEGNAQLPNTGMLMFDTISKISSSGGEYDKGYIDASLEIWKFFSKYDINGALNEVSSITNPNINKQVVKLLDVLGREVNQTTNQILFYIYDDGSVEKKFIVE